MLIYVGRSPIDPEEVDEDFVRKYNIRNIHRSHLSVRYATLKILSGVRQSTTRRLTRSIASPVLMFSTKDFLYLYFFMIATRLLVTLKIVSGARQSTTRRLTRILVDQLLVRRPTLVLETQTYFCCSTQTKTYFKSPHYEAPSVIPGEYMFWFQASKSKLCYYNNYYKQKFVWFGPVCLWR